MNFTISLAIKSSSLTTKTSPLALKSSLLRKIFVAVNKSLIFNVTGEQNPCYWQTKSSSLANKIFVTGDKIVVAAMKSSSLAKNASTLIKSSLPAINFVDMITFSLLAHQNRP